MIIRMIRRIRMTMIMMMIIMRGRRILINFDELEQPD